MSLFPAYSDANKDGDSKSTSQPSVSTNLFPSVSSDQQQPQSDANKLNLNCTSFPTTLIETLNNKQTKQTEIVISTDSESDSSIILVDDIINVSSSEESKSKHKHRKKKRKKDKKKNKKNKHRDTESSSKKAKIDDYDNSYLQFIPKGRAHFIGDIPNLKPEHAYRIDRLPDRDNCSFDRPYKAPKYFFKDIINTTKDRSTWTGKSSKKKIKRYFSKKSKLINVDDDEKQFVFAQKNCLEIENNFDYISINEINISTEPKCDLSKQIQFNSMMDSTDNSQDSIGPKKFPNRKQLIYELTSVFNRCLQSTPDDIQQWIDFIQFQDLSFDNSLLEAEKSGTDKDKDQQMNQTKSKHRQNWIEKKYSICEKALNHNRKSVELNLIKLKLMGRFLTELELDCNQIDREWKNCCFLFPNYLQFWFEWITFTIRGQRLLNFRANNRTRKVFRQAFASFSGKLLEGSFQSHQFDIVNIEHNLIDMTGFLAQFFLSIDQTEKSIAIFQALIEFNLFKPEELNFRSSFEEWFSLFEQYWDSGVSRIGEFNCTKSGWNYFQTQLKLFKKVEEKDERNFEYFNTQARVDVLEDTIFDTLNPMKYSENEFGKIKSQIWLHIERLRNRLQWLPVSSGSPINQSMDDVEDPERVVLSDDDLKPFLYRLRQPESKFYLIWKCFEMFNIPSITFALDSSNTASRFEYEFPFFATSDSASCTKRLFETNQSKFSRTKSYSEMFVLKKFGLSNVSSIDSALTLYLHDSLSQVNEDKSRQVFYENFFEKILTCFQDEYQWHLKLVLVWIQYKLDQYRTGKINASSIRKLIKDFLRVETFRNCLDIWNIYCCFEFEQKPSTGYRYFIQTIQLSLESITTINFKHLLRFTLSFVSCYLRLDQIMQHFIAHSSNVTNCLVCERCSKKDQNQSNDKVEEQTALKILVSVINQTQFDSNLSPTGVEVMRAINKISEQKFVEFIFAEIYLIYLSKGVDSALDFIEQQLQPDLVNTIQLDSKNTVLFLERSLLILQLQLMFRDYFFKQTVICSSRINLIRQIIKRALLSFPVDSLFLSILVNLEIKSSSLFRVRRYFNNYFGSTVDLEIYFLRKYLNGIDTMFDQWKTDADSLWNIFIAALHYELLIIDKCSGDDFAAFDINSGTLNRIRTLFERILNLQNNDNVVDTLNDYSLNYCPTIWRLYLRFEIKCNQLTKAKGALYRALQNCPNHKPLYLDGINFFPELLQEFVDLMTDKQLRLRTTIEEIDLILNAKKADE